MNRNRPLRVFSSQLGVIVYTLQLRVLTCCGVSERIR
jgi:hypothetical protein